MNIIIQITIGLGIAFSVFFATVLAKRRGFTKLFASLSSLVDKYSDTTARVVSLLGGQNLHGDRGTTISANSPMTISLKMSQISRHIEELDVSLSKEEQIWLTVLMLIAPWEDSILVIVPAQEMPEDIPKSQKKERVSVKDVKFADIEHEMSATVTALVPHNYLITALPNGRYIVKDGNIGAQDAAIENNITYATFDEAVEKMCAHHNSQVEQKQKQEKNTISAARRLAKDLQKWNSGK